MEDFQRTDGWNGNIVCTKADWNDPNAWSKSNIKQRAFTDRDQKQLYIDTIGISALVDVFLFEIYLIFSLLWFPNQPNDGHVDEC